MFISSSLEFWILLPKKLDTIGMKNKQESIKKIINWNEILEWLQSTILLLLIM